MLILAHILQENTCQKHKDDNSEFNDKDLRLNSGKNETDENVSTSEINTQNLTSNDLNMEVESISNISETDKFAITAICAVSLHNLFGNKWDEEFCLRTIKCILINLQLPQKVSKFCYLKKLIICFIMMKFELNVIMF